MTSLRMFPRVGRLGVDVALTLLGIKEATGSNDGAPADLFNRGDKLPWCASFCLYCNVHSDEIEVYQSVVEYYAERAVSGFEDHCKLLQWWMPAHVIPQRGDYIFFGDRGTSDASLTGRHMGVIDRVEPPTSLAGAILPGPPVLHTVEGNVGNRVQQLTHNLKNPDTLARITGYARIPIKE